MTDSQSAQRCDSPGDYWSRLPLFTLAQPRCLVPRVAAAIREPGQATVELFAKQAVPIDRLSGSLVVVTDRAGNTGISIPFLHRQEVDAEVYSVRPHAPRPCLDRECSRQG